MLAILNGGECPAKEFSNRPEFVTNFLSNSSKHILIVESYKPLVSLRRLEETVKNVKVCKDEESFTKEVSNPTGEREICVPTVYIEKSVKYTIDSLENLSRKVIIVVMTGTKMDASYVEIGKEDLRWKDLTLIGKFNATKMLNLDKDKFIDALKSIETSDLCDLMSGEGVELLRDTLPNRISYYINRKLIPRNILGPDVISRYMKDQDIICISGKTRVELTELVYGGQTEDSATVIQRGSLGTTRFIVLDPELENEHFEKISTLIPLKSIHHLDWKSSRIVWKRSLNGVKNIHPFVASSSSTITQDHLIDNLEEAGGMVTILSDAPGMGKSTLLADIGYVLRSKKRMVCFLLFSDLINELKDRYKSSPSNVDVAVRDLICKNSVGRAWYDFRENPLNDILLDGFDELVENDYALAYSCLEKLQEYFPQTNLWITSRPHLLDQLEIRLGAFGYNIEQFQTNNQIEFLRNFWSRDNPEKFNLERLRKFSEACVTELQGMLQSQEVDIAGIPLQCLLIGEVYQSDADLNCKKTVVTSESFKFTISIKNIVDLFRELIAKKFRIFQEKYNRQETDVQDLWMHHVYLAFLTILPELSKPILEYFCQDCISEKEILDAGLLIKSLNGKSLQFIHRTFAEYFIASYLFECERNDSNYRMKYFDVFLNQILSTSPVKLFYTPEYIESENPLVTVIPGEPQGVETRQFTYYVICFFVDSLLQSYESKQPEIRHDILNYLLGHMDTEKITECTKACAYNKLDNIYLNLMERLVMRKSKFQSVFTEGGLTVVALRASPGMAQSVFNDDICKEQLGRIIFGVNKNLTFLHLAVFRGTYSIIEIILSVSSVDRELKNENGIYANLIPKCVNMSSTNDASVIKEKKKIITLLGNRHKWLLNAKPNGTAFPLKCIFIHVELALLLLELGGDLYEYFDIEEFLHFSIKFYSTEEYQQVLEKVCDIYKDESDSLINSKDNSKRSLLYNIIDKLKPTKGLLEFLQSRGLRCKDLDDTKKVNIIYQAIKKKQSNECFTWIFDNLELQTEDAQICLDFAIREEWYIPVELLVEKYQIDYNKRNHNNKKPLEALLSKGYCEKVVSLAKLFIRNGTELTSSNQTTIDNSVLESVLRLPYTNLSTEILDTAKNEGQFTETEVAFLKLKWIFMSGPQDETIFNKMYKEMKKADEILVIVDSDQNNLLHLSVTHERFSALIDLSNKMSAGLNAVNMKGLTPLECVTKNHSCKWYEWAASNHIDKFFINIPQEGSLLRHMVQAHPCRCRKVALDILEHAKDNRPNDYNCVFLTILEFCDFSVGKHLLEWHLRFYGKKELNSVQEVCSGTECTILDIVFQKFDINLLKLLTDTNKFNCCRFNHELLQTNVRKHVVKDSISEVDFVSFFKSVEIFSKEFLNATNSTGKTVLMVEDISVNATKAILKLGGDVNARDGYGNNALHWAFRRMDSSIIPLVQTLIEHGVDVNLVNNRQYSPLKMCVCYEWLQHSVECFTMLVNAGADVRFQDEMGNTVLHRLPGKIIERNASQTAKKQFSLIVNCLRKNGCMDAFHIVSKDNMTPIQLVKQHLKFSDEEINRILQ